ncbi:hypothetical protein OUQ99_03285 [Streptomonospora nanhaiensis]|uniref:Interferon-induced transmembrane protein n=1 Tax=Streptomonospora nanhaiensis TaxID=1323731 RepID=A0ABY6YPB1_9ACTN|nr:hypothetical protein [Streptomonospora nanhaiensis]WAE74164.1 hypothetical protein OUQ99_03285 [Streptomonospora nanhaiensis]
MSDTSLPPGASSPRDHGRDDDRDGGRGRSRGAGRRDRPRADEPDGREEWDGRDDDREGSRTPLPGGANSSTMALILHALTFLCCANWLFGVAGIVFAVRAAHARDRGRPVQAETLTRYSWYCLGAAGVMFFVMLVLTFVMFTQAGSWIQGIVPVTNY